MSSCYLGFAALPTSHIPQPATDSYAASTLNALTAGGASRRWSDTASTLPRIAQRARLTSWSGDCPGPDSHSLRAGDARCSTRRLLWSLPTAMVALTGPQPRTPINSALGSPHSAPPCVNRVHRQPPPRLRRHIPSGASPALQTPSCTVVTGSRLPRIVPLSQSAASCLKTPSPSL